MIEPSVVKIAGYALSTTLGLFGALQISTAVPTATDLSSAIKKLERASNLIEEATHKVESYAHAAHAEANITIHQTSIFDAVQQEREKALQLQRKLEADGRK